MPYAVAKNRAFNFAKNPKYDGSQRGLASMVDKFFDKKTLLGQLNLKLQISNLQMNFINQLLKIVRKEEFVHHLEIIFGVVILQICN